MKGLKTKGRAAVGALASLTVVASMAATPALAAQPVDAGGIGAGDACEVTGEGTVAASMVKAQAEGVFSYSQDVVTPNSVIRELFQKAVRVICGSQIPLAVENPLDWQISVSGAVDEAYTATIDELAGEESVQQKMTCTCGGNPTGGRAIVTADVKGVPVEAMLARAGVQSEANAVTFVAADGTKTTLPLGYVIGRHAVISYEINDEDLSASVGGNNQLWMTRTPANYFVRDVVEIVVSCEDELPAAPGEADEHPNSPNAGVLVGIQE